MEIKFRGWDEENRVMLEPQDLSQNGAYWKWLGKNDVPLMQYTGMKDKNGKEIYEGDVIGQYRGHEYESRNRVIKWNPDYCGWWLYLRDKPHLGLDPTREDLEVIGNIHENKELLP